MPCTGSDKAFYREVGLAPTKPASVVNSPIAAIPTIEGSKSSDPTSSNTANAVVGGALKTVSTQIDCKSQIHKKTGVSLPCSAPDYIDMGMMLSVHRSSLIISIQHLESP